MDSRPLLADLLHDPAGLEDVPREDIPQLRGELALLDTRLLSRLLTPGAPQEPQDQLLTVEEAAGRLGCSRDYLYRHHTRLPFTRRVGRKLLFSARGLEKHICQKRPI
jgi:excisionase family DNA binding protein